MGGGGDWEGGLVKRGDVTLPKVSGSEEGRGGPSRNKGNHCRFVVCRGGP